MKIGVMTTPWENVGDMVAIARMAEDRGIDSLWVGEHSHLPVTTRHAFADNTPEFYRHVPDPYITLAAVAASTTTIRIGTGIALPAECEPLGLAKVIASLDTLAGGRFEWGVGYGWNKLEMVNRGVDPRYRMARFREVVLAVRALWTAETAGFGGDHVRFTESWSWPKPVQRPHPPILLGCRPGPRAFAQLTEFCDGWLPSVTQCGDGLDETLTRLRSAWTAAGRVGRPALTFIDTGFSSDVDVDTFRARTETTKGLAARLADCGTDRLIVGMPLFRLTDAEPMLDSVAALT